jgi:glycosyltransferase involved in cell wall biosynthesis
LLESSRRADSQDEKESLRTFAYDADGKRFPVPGSLRIAIVVDPLTLSAKGGDHPPRLASELLGRGHVVKSFGAPAGEIPESSSANDPDMDKSEREGLLRFRPDVILAYDALSPAAALGARAARKLRAPLVLVEGDVPGGGSAWQRILWRVGEVLFRTYVQRSADAVVALDPVAHDRALREGFRAESISILPLGVDLAQFRPGLTSHVVVQHHVRGRMILYVGPFEEARGVDLLIQAFARTVGQRDDWSLVLAGDGPERPRLRALCERLGVGARVHWLGRPRREELPGLFGATTLFAVPALAEVVLGRNVGRAMAAGVPVLASDLSRMRFYVRHEHTGLLVKPGDLDAWTEALRLAAGSPVARARWGKNSRALAEERFSWPSIAGAFEILFQGACARAQAPETLRQGAGS